MATRAYSIFYSSLFVLIINALFITIFAENTRLPYKVFRISPQNWEDMASIKKLRQSLSEENEIDFWLDSQNLKQFTELMVAPYALRKFETFMNEHGLNYTVTIDNVEELIRTSEIADSRRPISQRHYKPNAECRQNCNPDSKRLNEFLRARLRDGPPTSNAAVQFDELPFSNRVSELRATYSFGMYTDYADMVRYMRMLDFYYPHIVRVVQIGRTHEGRSIEGVMVGYPVTNNTKRVFWIDGNIHAREWASSHTALFIINQLVAGYGKNVEITHYLNSINFLIVPCTNPDGFEYSRSSIKPQIRLWRKNRSPERCVPSVWGGVRCCQGVDLNRNFDFHWGETGSSSNPCSNLYAGIEAFSEPESRAISDYLNSPELYGRVDAFVTLHTYAQMWIYPYSHKLDRHPQDHETLKNVARVAVERLGRVYGTRYRIGTGAELLSPASGGSDDWAKEKLGVKFVYLVELRPQLEQSQGFILKQEQLIPTAIETFEGIKAVTDSVLQYNYISRRTGKPRQSNPSPSLTISATTRATIQTTTPVFAENDMVDPRDKRVELEEIQLGLEHDLLRLDSTLKKFVQDTVPNRPTATFNDQIIQSEFGSAESQKIMQYVTPPSATTQTTQLPSKLPAEIRTSSHLQPDTEQQLLSTVLMRDLTITSSTITEIATTKEIVSTVTVTRELPAITTTTTPITPRTTTTSATTTAPMKRTTATTSSISTTPTTTTIPPRTTTPITTTILTATTTPVTTTTTIPIEILTNKFANETKSNLNLTAKSPLQIPTMDWLTTSILFSVTVPSNDELKEAVVLTTRTPTLQYAPRFITQPIAPLIPSAPFQSAPSFSSRSDGSLDKAFNVPLLHGQSNGNSWSEMAMVVAPLYAINDSTKNGELVLTELSTNNVDQTSSSTIASKLPCRDRKYSCVFWIRAHPSICLEKQHFMRLNCAFSCKFCSLKHR